MPKTKALAITYMSLLLMLWLPSYVSASTVLCEPFVNGGLASVGSSPLIACACGRKQIFPFRQMLSLRGGLGDRAHRGSDLRSERGQAQVGRRGDAAEGQQAQVLFPVLLRGLGSLQEQVSTCFVLYESSKAACVHA